MKTDVTSGYIFDYNLCLLICEYFYAGIQWKQSSGVNEIQNVVWGGKRAPTNLIVGGKICVEKEKKKSNA